MIAVVARDVVRTFTGWRLVPMLVFIAIPIVYGSIARASFGSPMHVFQYVMTGPAVLIFPIVAVLVAVLPFSSEWKNNFIGLVRTRTTIGSYSRQKFVANFVAVFLVFFLYASVSAIYFLVIQPVFGAVDYDFEPSNQGPSQMGRLSGAYAISPALWLTIYAGVMGLVAALFASISFLGLFVFKARLLALSIPFILFVVQHLVIPPEIEGMGFLYAFVQFGGGQTWTLAVPILELVAIIGILAWRVRALRGNYPGLA